MLQIVSGKFFKGDRTFDTPWSICLSLSKQMLL
jgi:hypothetical protein